MNKLIMEQLTPIHWLGKIYRDDVMISVVQDTAFTVRTEADVVFGVNNYVIERIYLEEM